VRQLAEGKEQKQKSLHFHQRRDYELILYLTTQNMDCFFKKYIMFKYYLKLNLISKIFIRPFSGGSHSDFFKIIK
jgi:hypothetical protein